MRDNLKVTGYLKLTGHYSNMQVLKNINQAYKTDHLSP